MSCCSFHTYSDQPPETGNQMAFNLSLKQTNVSHNCFCPDKLHSQEDPESANSEACEAHRFPDSPDAASRSTGLACGRTCTRTGRTAACARHRARALGCTRVLWCTKVLWCTRASWCTRALWWSSCRRLSATQSVSRCKLRRREYKHCRSGSACKSSQSDSCSRPRCRAPEAGKSTWRGTDRRIPGSGCRWSRPGTGRPRARTAASAEDWTLG